MAAGETIPQIVGWMAHSAGLTESGRPTTPGALLAGFELARLARAPVVLPPAGSP